MDQAQSPSSPPPPPSPEKDPKRTIAGPSMPPWRSIVWYLPLALFIIWAWQEWLTAPRVKTIPYSEFKQYLADDEVTEAEVKQDDIDGKIVPKSHATPKTTPTEKTASPQKAAPVVPAQKSPEKKGAEKLPAAKESAPAAAESNETTPEAPFNFRTIRVEDPKLVDELVAHHV